MLAVKSDFADEAVFCAMTDLEQKAAKSLKRQRLENKIFCLTKVRNFVLQFSLKASTPSYPYPNTFWEIFLDLELDSVEDNCSAANRGSLRCSVPLRCQPLQKKFNYVGISENEPSTK